MTKKEAAGGKPAIPGGDRQIEIRKLADLRPRPTNPRLHPPEQIAQIQASMREFGWTNPVLIDEMGGIIAGHGRVEAAQGLGLEEAPCIVVDGLEPDQIRALVIADNQTALGATWDEELLGFDLMELTESGFSVEAMGFDLEEAASLVSAVANVGSEELPPAPNSETAGRTFTIQVDNDRGALIDRALEKTESGSQSDRLFQIISEWLGAQE